ncbi:MAG: hypothetical protein ABEI74_01690 [Candidatus Pacearchaeota archaeon]
MITYNDIYETARKERYTDQLQPLPKNFISNVAKYIKEKKQLTMKDQDEFSDEAVKTKKQLENAIAFFRELMLRRRKKILNLMLVAAETGISKKDFENMLDFEKELFEEMMQCMEKSDKKLNQMLNEGEEKGEKPNENELIMFKQEVEAFAGPDGENLGPFEKGQVASLPKEIAKILINGGKAELVYEKEN